MAFDVCYHKLTETVLGNCMNDAATFYDGLKGRRKKLRTHITKYMGAAEEKNLYQPFCDFANELLTDSTLRSGTLDRLAQSRPNHHLTRANLHRKSDTPFTTFPGHQLIVVHN